MDRAPLSVHRGNKVPVKMKLGPRGNQSGPSVNGYRLHEAVGPTLSISSWMKRPKSLIKQKQLVRVGP